MGKLYFSFFIILICTLSCKEPPLPPNPFAGNEPSGDTLLIPNQSLDPTSIEGLHATIFRPTCANSGCHDGNFEPDFRSIESTYNTLVYQPIIKNNPTGDFTYRVLPGNAESSVLWERLNNDIDGQSGLMPLAVEPTSDWRDKKEEYIANIKNWVESGAKDIFGNSPKIGNIQPSIRGVIGYANGNGNILDREPGSGGIIVPAGANTLDVWVSLVDDQTNPTALGHNKVKLSPSINNFSGAQQINLQTATPRTEVGLFGTPETYYHKFTVNLAGYASGSQLFVRVLVKDPEQSEITEIPSEGSAFYMKEYFSFIVN